MSGKMSDSLLAYLGKVGETLRASGDVSKRDCGRDIGSLLAHIAALESELAKLEAANQVAVEALREIAESDGVCTQAGDGPTCEEVEAEDPGIFQWPDDWCFVCYSKRRARQALAQMEAEQAEGVQARAALERGEGAS